MPYPDSPLIAVVCALAIAAMTAILWVFAPNIGSSTPASSTATTQFPPAPKIEGIAHWLNSEPVSFSDLRGQVVLLDFWTYTCVNCFRTVPQLRAWHDQYADDGLTIVGIHTPEFEFEKEPANVLLAAESQGIVWPIALDNDYVTWDNYENAFWPTKYLIDTNGRLRYHRVGEGNYASFEKQIRALLIEAGGDLSDDSPTSGNEHATDARYEASPDREITRELYAGYDRGHFEREYYGAGFVGQPEYYALPGQVLDLDEPEYLEPGFLYFKGRWRNDSQHAIHDGNTTDFEDYVTLVYSARAVNAVLSSESGEPLKARIWLDGEYLTEENRGADVTIGPDGESYVWVDQVRMYQLVKTPITCSARG